MEESFARDSIDHDNDKGAEELIKKRQKAQSYLQKHHSQYNLYKKQIFALDTILSTPDSRLTPAEQTRFDEYTEWLKAHEATYLRYQRFIS